MERHHFGAGRGLHLRIVVAVRYGVGCSDPAVQAGSGLTAPGERNLTIRGEPSPARVMQRLYRPRSCNILLRSWVRKSKLLSISMPTFLKVPMRQRSEP